jgi:hypothetical protein
MNGHIANAQPKDTPMTAQERDQLQHFLVALRQQSSHPRDRVAEGLIRDALAQQPDAPYWLVQRSMALQLALNAAQARLAQLQAQCDAPMAPVQDLAAELRPAAAPMQPSPWGRGLLAQVGGTALGVATGMVAGGAVLQGLQSVWGPDATTPHPAEGITGNLPTSEPDAGNGLWDLGDDWA